MSTDTSWTANDWQSFFTDIKLIDHSSFFQCFLINNITQYTQSQAQGNTVEKGAIPQRAFKPEEYSKDTMLEQWTKYCDGRIDFLQQPDLLYKLLSPHDGILDLSNSKVFLKAFHKKYGSQQCGEMLHKLILKKPQEFFYKASPAALLWSELLIKEKFQSETQEVASIAAIVDNNLREESNKKTVLIALKLFTAYYKKTGDNTYIENCLKTIAPRADKMKAALEYLRAEKYAAATPLKQLPQLSQQRLIYELSLNHNYYIQEHQLSVSQARQYTTGVIYYILGKHDGNLENNKLQLYCATPEDYRKIQEETTLLIEKTNKLIDYWKKEGANANVPVSRFLELHMDNILLEEQLQKSLPPKDKKSKGKI